ASLADSIREALTERLEALGLRVVVDEPTIVSGCMRSRVDNSDAQDALAVAIGIAREEQFARCSLGLSRGSVLLESESGRRRAYGAAVQHSMALALRGAERKVLVDPGVHSLSDSNYAFRSFGDRVFELDGAQPQWIDRWEEAALVAEPELSGRDELLGRLSDALHKTPVALIGLRGRAGLGRQSVALEALRRRGVADERIYESTTHSMAAEPYWPVVALVRSMLGLRDEPLGQDTLRGALRRMGAWSESLESTLNALLSVEPPEEDVAIDELDAASFRHSIAQALAETVRAAAQQAPESPIALVIHEAQRLDGPSAHAIAQLSALYDGPTPLVVILTYKGRLRTANLLSRSVDEFSLAPLPQGPLRAMVCEALDTEELDGSLWELIQGRSRGSPMFAITLIRFLVETGSLKRTDGEWRLDSWSGDRPIPRQHKELIEARIQHLPMKLAAVLHACASMGEPVVQRALELIWVSRGWSLEALQQSVGLLVEMGFVHRTDGGAVSIAHPLIRQVAYRHQSEQQRVEHHRMALVAYRERYPDAIRQIPSLMVAHSVAAGELETARDAALYAARRAVKLHDFRSGLAAVEQGLEVLDRMDTDSPSERFDLLSIREQILDARNERSEQQRDLDAMVAIAEETDDPRQLALSLHRAARLHLLSGRPKQAHVLAGRALLYARDGDPLDLSNTLRTVALIRWQHRDSAGAAEALSEALELYEQLEHPRGMGYVLHNLGLFALDTGAFAKARAYLQRALALKQRTEDPLGRAAVLDALGQVALNEGRSDAAAGALETALAVRLERGDRNGANTTRVMLGEALLPSAPKRSESLAASALAGNRGRRANPRTRAEASLVLARARLRLGKRDSASRLATRALKAATDVGAPLLLIRAQLVQAQVDLRYRSRRRLDRAEQHARSAVESAERAGATRWRVEALSVLAEVLRHLRSPEREQVAARALAMLDEKSVVGIDETRIRERCAPQGSE
ncbi:MAG: tetratricopeptide repeat protein, partial [Myxococcota bacterium]